MFSRLTSGRLLHLAIASLLAMPFTATAQYNISYWVSMSKKIKDMEGEPDYQQFTWESPFAGKVMKNPDWYADSLRAGGARADFAKEDAATAARELEALLQAYQDWRVMNRERAAREKEENIEIARNADELTGTIPEFRQQLVSHLQATARGESTEYTKFSANDSALNVESKLTLDSGVISYSERVPWAAVAGGEIVLTHSPFAKKKPAYMVQIKMKEKAVAGMSREEGKPEQSYQQEGAAIDFSGNKEAAWRAAMLWRRAAGITNPTPSAVAAPSRQNDVSEATTAPTSGTQPTSAVSIEIINLDAPAKSKPAEPPAQTTPTNSPAPSTELRSPENGTSSPREGARATGGNVEPADTAETPQTTGFYTVDGEVRYPNRFACGEKVTVLSAISLAGGFTDFANKKKVKLTRVDNTTANVDCVNALQDTSLDLSVHPGDKIHVGRKVW